MEGAIENGPKAWQTAQVHILNNKRDGGRGAKGCKETVPEESAPFPAGRQVSMKINKRKNLQEQIKFAAAILFLLIFLPVLGAVLLSGKEALAFQREPDFEGALPLLLYQEIPDNFKQEAAAAQAVLLRSRIWLEAKEGDKRTYYSQLTGKNLEYERKRSVDEKKMNVCQSAVKETEGLVLTYGENVVEGPFCRASCGWTRNGKEALGDERWGWIVAVESSEDLDYRPSLPEAVFTEEELYENLKEELEEGGLVKEGILDSIEIIGQDTSGYVTDLKAGGIRMSGEKFRRALGLPSASFTLSRQEDTVRIVCRGEGHGLGLSQNGAAEMEREGAGFREILNRYFPNAQITEKNFE